MRLQQETGRRKTGKLAAAAGHGGTASRHAWLLVVIVLALGGCATTGGDKGLVIDPLSRAHYAPSQTVDVLASMPARAHETLARLTLTDPTGNATSSQLTAQLTEAARHIGADALVLEQVSRPAATAMAFNPSGGQMQHTDAGGASSISALAIRYTR